MWTLGSWVSRTCWNTLHLPVQYVYFLGWLHAKNHWENWITHASLFNSTSLSLVRSLSHRHSHTFPFYFLGTIPTPPSPPFPFPSLSIYNSITRMFYILYLPFFTSPLHFLSPSLSLSYVFSFTLAVSFLFVFFLLCWVPFLLLSIFFLSCFTPLHTLA